MRLRNRIVAGMLLLTLATVNTVTVPGSLVNVSAADAETKQHSVVYLGEGHDCKPDQVNTGEPVAEPATPERTGYVFLGWYQGEEKYDFSKPVTDTLLLTAKWEESEELKRAKTAFETIEKERETLKAEYFDNGEWTLFEEAYQATKAEYSKGEEMDAVVLDELVATLQARKMALDETRKKVTVTLQTGILQDFKNQVNMGEAVAEPITPSRTGYVFGGWYADGYLYDFTTPVEKDIVLVATWIEDTELAAAKASFQAVSDRINGMDANLYTPESWNNLVTAYDAAKLGVETADAAVLRQLTASLETVVSNLVMKNAVGAQAGTDPYGAVAQKDIKVTELEIEETYTKLAAGKKLTLSVQVMPEDATNKAVVWSSSNKKVATVSKKGVVKAKKVTKSKKVTITATAADGSGVVAEYEIKVMPQAVKSITLKAPSTTVAAGDKLTITATVSPAPNKKLLNSELEWVSSNLKYATVSEKGVVKTKEAGSGKTVKITASATDGSKKKATIKIKID